MTYTSSVTQKGQITLPKVLRDKLNIKEREKVIIEEESGYIKIKPTTDILDFAGYLNNKVDKKKAVKKAREAFESEYHRV